MVHAQAVKFHLTQFDSELDDIPLEGINTKKVLWYQMLSDQLNVMWQQDDLKLQV